MPKGVYKRIKPNHWLGKKHKEISKIKIGLKLKGHTAWNKNLKGFMKGRITSELTKKKIRLSNLGQKRPEKVKSKMRGRRPNFHGNSGSFKKGDISPMKGRVGIRGKNHYNWIDDRTQLKRFNDIAKDRRSSAYGNWRHQVKTRDNFKCKILNADCKGRIEVHHILSYTKHSELRYEINNGITLCKFHHPRKKTEEERLSPYFKELISQINQ